MKKLILVMVIVEMVVVAGCGCISHEDVATQSEEIHSTIIVDGTSIEYDKEVELLVRAFTMGGMGGDDKEEDAKYYVEIFHQYDIVIIEMYRGSLIYHEPSYGYFWWPELEEDFRDMSIIRERYPRDEELFFVVPQKFNGDNAVLELGDPFYGPYWICCFNNLEDTRSFLRHIYSYEGI